MREPTQFATIVEHSLFLILGFFFPFSLQSQVWGQTKRHFGFCLPGEAGGAGPSAARAECSSHGQRQRGFPGNPGWFVPRQAGPSWSKHCDSSTWLKAEALEPCGCVQLSFCIAATQSRPGLSLGWNSCLHQMHPGKCLLARVLRALALAPIAHLSPSLWKSALKCHCSSCFPWFWAVAAPQAPAQGMWEWGSAPNNPKQPQNSSRRSVHTRAAHRKMGEYSSMRVMSFQGQKVADEFALSAWKRSCDITQKFKNTEFLGGSHPPGQGSSPTVALTFTGARHRLCYGTAGKAAPHPQLS